MNQILVGSQLSYTVKSPTTFLFNISVAQNRHQSTTSESIEILPFHKIDECAVGALGNRLFRVSAMPGEMTVQYRATVELHAEEVNAADLNEVDYQDLPADVLAYLNPSRYCESDKLYRFAGEEFGDLVPGYSRVTAICNWVFDQITYVPGTTGPTTTACDVLLQRTGVCRDYAHVAISLCRAMGIPARYVSGYAANLQPADFHGFFEAYFDGRWFLFDATRLAPIGGFVRIGTGRDAADVAFATIRGDVESTEVGVWANQQQGGDPLLDSDNVQTAISSS
ncbi:transglutaminase family protein [Stieleria sp. TO1_6]|uniref:transglutaminase-like domain-containing protein n=1 Tax=Stieleria tagensis TaxID=2956795 RepID=UPI00209B0B92|nr:transglutaminase family protein [Stieleria tagensis]MCO8121343.1 transglutaminase family protein [Stieleria tagensis]